MTNNIQYKLDILNNFFNLEDSLSVKADKQYIQKYYSINRIPYSILHSRSNFVHMGVSQNETFEHEDLLYFDKQLDNLIKQNKFTSVLELASGRGANSKFLAERNPQTYFTGCDISEAQLKFARKYEENLSNLEFIENDFHSLPNVQDASVDLCFIIEAFCYSDTPEKLFAEIYKKLRPGGYFYIADGFLEKTPAKLTDIEFKAKRLTEIGMAVNDIKYFDDFKKISENQGFEVVNVEDVSAKTIPTMRRFERYANGFFRTGFIAKILLKLLPKKFTWNILSGYLLPEIMRSGLGSYKILLLRKKDAR